MTSRVPGQRGAATSSAAARLGRALAESRLRAGLTQEEVAERASCSVRGLRNIELGLVRRPRRRTVAALTTALELSPEAAAHVHRLASAARGTGHSGHDGHRTFPLPLRHFVGRRSALAELGRAVREATGRPVTPAA